MYKILAILLLSLTGSLYAQATTQSHVEHLRGLWVSAFTQGIYSLPVNERVIHFASTLKGTPYVAGVLDRGTAETLIINAQELDCVTFVDNVLALSVLTDTLNHFEHAFGDLLTKIRYQEAQINGYSSRLHYSTAWLLSMQQNGLLINATPSLELLPFIPQVDFMSRNYLKYPRLKTDSTNLSAIRAMEHNINSTSIAYIPKEKVINNVYNSIKNGDIILITTNIKGLDTSHLGIAIKKGKTVYLIHASSEKGAVVETQQPLREYLMGVKNQSGIIIARPL
ncbi:MAG: N-acetylmuramoyl-L-alanine amidase-like domain-containing protein [Marinifilaceae bacterium]